MKKNCLLLYAFFIICVASLSAQSNVSLSKQIDSLAEADQKWRRILAEPIRLHIDASSKRVMEQKMKTTDSLNYIAVKKIFDREGFPGYDRVGRTGSHNFWLLVLHQEKHPDFQEAVLLKMKAEVDRKNASAFDYAFMVDKKLSLNKQPQQYGTQLRVNKDSTSYEPLPVLEPEKLNERRKSIGLSSMEDYIKMKNTGVFDVGVKK